MSFQLIIPQFNDSKDGILIRDNASRIEAIQKVSHARKNKAESAKQQLGTCAL
jgi:hypothetical protein